MAINFPDSPAENDSFTSGGKKWIFNGTVWTLVTANSYTIPTGEVTTDKIATGAVHEVKLASAAVTAAKLASGAAVANIGYTPANVASPTFTGTVVLPSTTSIGTVTSTELSYVDGVTSSIQTQLDTKAAISSLVPVGVISAYAGSSAPSGWLMCAGQAVSRSTYAALFTALSTTYGVGDGSTTFNLPDLRGRVPAGVDNMGGSAASRLTNAVLTASNTLGATGGAQTHTLDSSQIPAHSHPNTLGSNTVAATSHTHGSSAMTASMNLFNAAGTNYIDYAERQGTTFTETERMYWPAGGADAAHNESTTTGIGILGSTDANSSSTTVSITNANNTGGGSAHTNTQPTLVLNYIIKATQ